MARAWCKHYRGMHKKDTCEAGVKFTDLQGYGVKGFFDTCPCFGSKGTKCDKAEYPSAEEMEAEDREIAERFANLGKARKAIVDHLGGPWKKGMVGMQGTIDCPVCGAEKSLCFSRSGYNGHIHAKCATESCVCWME